MQLKNQFYLKCRKCDISSTACPWESKEVYDKVHDVAIKRNHDSFSKGAMTIVEVVLEPTVNVLQKLF